MKKFLFFLVPCILCIGFQQTRMVKTKVNDSITMLLPQDFMPMSPQEINTKYVSAKAPIAAYSDYSKEVDLGVNVAYSQWNQEDLEIMKSFYKSNIMGFYSEVQFLTENIQEINGRNFVVFEFLGNVIDTEGTSITGGSITKFIRIQYTIVQGKTVLFNFSCPGRFSDKWAPLVKEMMESVKIAKTL